ncbi:rho GTPase-activating protein 23-like isoform X1 [Haliotis asinina]|uniref:rho GTPase-activating protein 23-like isoform X1 n=2 Tax=Haliotis asinina TaxID=109174 RepID=UPI00353232EF
MESSQFDALDWAGPRTVLVPRTDQGFGFTLRHFIVYPPEITDDSSQGEDLEHNGSEKRSKRSKLASLEPMDTIFVKNVKEESPAHVAGLKTGDRIVSVNGESVTGKSYSQVISLIQSSDAALKLLVVPKDEDILQLAYHPQAQDSISGSNGSLNSDRQVTAPIRRAHSAYASNENVLSPESRQESRLSFTVKDHRNKDYYTDRSREFGPYPLKTSASFGSALSSYKEPLRSDNSYNREAFFRDSDFDYRNPHGFDGVSMSSSVSCSIPQKKYSFGLYFPPQKGDNKSNSMDGLNKGSNRYSKENIRDTGSELRPRRLGYEHRQPSFDNTSDNSQSKESLLRSQERLGIDSKPPPYSPGGSKVLKSGDSTSIIISRSHTTSSLSSPASNMTSQSPYRSQLSSRRGSDVDYKTDIRGVRHYVPVVSANPLEKGTKSSSVDNIDSRLSRFQTQRSWHTDSNRFHDQSNPESPMRTFVVRIPVGERSLGSDGTDGGGKGSGTTFALTRSPVTTQIEIKKTPRQIVSHRKQLFELGKNENHSPGVKFDRCKTELEKMTTFKKFESVANRAAVFEQKQESPEPEVPSNSASVQPAIKVRKISTERYIPPKLSNDKPDRPATLASYQEAPAPIRIYVSPGSSSAPVSPIVEIVPVFQEGQSAPKMTTSLTHDPQPRQSFNHEESTEEELYPQARIVQENIHGSRPVRKTSYLSAVNAPRSRYSHDASDDDEDDVDGDDTLDNLESPSSIPEPLGSTTSLGSSAGSISIFSSYSNVPSVMSSSDGGVMLSRMDPVSTSGSTFLGSSMDTVISEPGVQMRSKTIASPEEEAVKLHRRTSYLMATARDRSNQQPYEQSFSPPASIPEGQLATPPHKPSLNKIKHFFGEKTPCIIEAMEPKIEMPESPLADIVKEGWLTCKTTVTDGKKSSDRSWKEVWVVLRGHCLFLFKERRETQSTFNFDDEKPISIKSSLVDIKHEYAKRKKHVFQLVTYNGSEYLFQADDKGTMLLWIQAIKTNNNPDCDVRKRPDEGIGNADLIRRKSSQAELTVKTSPTAAHKPSKKHSALSLKKAASPSVKRKKTGSEKDTKSRGWKERIMPSFKKHHENNSSTALSEMDEECMKTAAFGVPLDQCMPSPHNEYVPLIVELCTRIVEARGLEVVGVYRVPGNSVAVQNMQEELNKGIENVNIDNEKWLDVNVISSLLKAFFRKLPEPLVTNKCYASFIEANRISDPEKRMLKLKRRLHTLPEHHFETFKRMAEHLNRVAAYGHINKMNAKNLATMFGPTLIRKSEDDTISMVTDMSDQCHIVESIIIHFDWFFSSWEDDHTVPSEEVSETPVTSDVRVMRDDDEDLDSVINTREIVSSIISAAHKKLHSKQNQKSMDSLDFDESFNERDIDLEISRKASSATKMSKSQSTISSVPSSRSISEEFLDRKLSSSTMKSLPQSTVDETESLDFDCIDSKSEFKSQSKSFNVSTFSRHYSDESLLDRNDELEMSHGMSSTWSLSRDTLDRLKRIEYEARALREREEQRQRDMEKCRREQQRIEQEYQRTKKEMEMEETHSVEDLLNWRPDYSHRLQDTSEYSGSDNRGSIGASHRHYPSTDSSQSGGHPDGKVQLRRPDSQHERGHGGKYFVSIGNTRGRSRERSGGRVTQGSLDSLAPRFSRAGSLENILDSHGHIHPPQSHVRGPSYRQRDGRRDSRHEGEKKRTHGTLSRGGSVRHGSLDSLIDLYDKQDNRGSWASSDSEDGSDLLTSLTTTFDQKLQILLNPKYKLSGSRRAGHRAEDVSSASNVEEAVEDKDNDVEKTVEVVSHKNTPVVLPQHGVPGIGDFSRDRPFRDPSLHRSSKSETKIGIASRFERGNQVTPPQSTATVLPVTGSPQSLQNRKSTQELKAFPFKFTGKSVSETGATVTSPPTLTQPKKLETKPVSKSDFRPISKSEKTEVNSTLAKLSREEKYFSSRDAVKSAVFSKPACRSESPVGDKKRTKRSKRRHTVGGTNDLEHFKALISVTSGKEAETEPKVSAWEQLQPVVKETAVPENRSLLSWIQSERLRGSTPDLTSESKH